MPVGKWRSQNISLHQLQSFSFDFMDELTCRLRKRLSHPVQPYDLATIADSLKHRLERSSDAATEVHDMIATVDLTEIDQHLMKLHGIPFLRSMHP
ncbi:hypothetical protein KL86PLE_40565 [uncultured Pleomorphomonas sp.]|uniref:Uncharacterized protein n=1 Tax=uncultured Pleomorphomonas sp. TaxID=442121 RepID=A0A212LGZ6_9HYPH|nr:hypothetical protein KL86PLE_40565 [uncultured Pleomorphomonas sp.]